MEDPNRCRHLCVDMQRMFAEDTPWHIPWMPRVREPVAELTGTHPAETIFTRFVPPRTSAEAGGSWRSYYEKWAMMTRERLGDEMVDILPELRAFVPPALVFDKPVYSPWLDGRLHHFLQDQGVTTLVISGGETDVCVLAAILGAVDLGYAIILVKDAICSTSDETHDASLALFGRRFSTQLRIAGADEVLQWWQG
ncbi:nicotinamidase-related amidase [Neorhizobium sp. R1-B]|uniref:cysteine hydrolase family protein n=1 Tax=Neorhizobium TaxID=1525371 RepID=UPI000CF9D115|nr:MULTISPECIES: isochorismatase family cysteine hydrolase [Neorhizobium]TCV73546.1 nicotinamidase-related amidase [Neorhizobium sp. S3-V5DH]TDX85718.1 nicotinamidase-related amidase [Neorhizobium sp. R1-B]